MNTDAEAKIKLLNNSMRCFVFGLLGLIPLMGLPFAFAALVISGEVRTGQKKYWNAARPYWFWGVVCAASGPIFWSLILALIILARIQSSNHTGD